MTRPRVNEPLGVPPTEPTQSDARRSPLVPEEISVVGLLNVLLRYRVLIILLPLAFGFRAGLRSFTAPLSYTTVAQFMPKGGRGQSQISGIAAQFGIPVSGGEGSQSSQFYMDLLESRPLLSKVADERYTVQRDSTMFTGNLYQIFKVSEPRAAVRRVKVVERLQAAISATTSARTGVITVTVRSSRPELSQQIATNLLEQVNVANLARRQEQAAAERGFVERQMGEKRAELRMAESELGSFLERNRQWRTSPQLTLEQGRLQRAVDMRQSIYTNLLQAYETARIEEVRDLPLITIVEPPEAAVVPDVKGGVRKTLIGMITGLVLAIVLAFVLDRMARNRAAQTDDFREFAQLSREAMGDLTHPWRPVARVFRSRQRT
ncbi:MAG: hypothetical protein H0T48_04510 [Gemmatimonadaceae bacterium]|nr:hypothetical protein [Gemmatimonadaceae bacterium]